MKLFFLFWCLLNHGDQYLVGVVAAWPYVVFTDLLFDCYIVINLAFFS